MCFFFKKMQMTALHWACKRGLYNIAEFLINKGSDLNACDVVF